MIESISQSKRYQNELSNGKVKIYSDTTKDGIGGTEGFRPHELLEAALASCMNITVQMKAGELGLQLERIVTKVTLNRDMQGQAIFEYSIQLSGDISEQQKRTLMEAAANCPVCQTLLRSISFSAKE